MTYNPKKLRRVVLKEELVALTGDPKSAMLLNQLIFWSARVYDFDDFINEEKRRGEAEGIDVNIEPTNGWFYKSIDELVKELMGIVARDKMLKYMDDFVKTGYLSRRKNPQYKWDRTNQYRMNIGLIQRDLRRIGYSLEGYRCDIPVITENPNMDNLSGSSIVDISTIHSLDIDLQKSESQSLKVERSTSNTIDYTIDYTIETAAAAKAIVKKTNDADAAAVIPTSNVKDIIKQIQNITNTEKVRVDGLRSVLTMPNGIERLQKAVQHYPQFAQDVEIKNPIGFLCYIATNNIVPPKKENSGCSFVKKVDFAKFPQHIYNKEDLDRLFEPVT